MANSYETDNVLVAWGYDFAYWDALHTFGLIKDIKDFLEVRYSDIFDVKFSTVSTYLAAVKQEIADKKIELQVFTEDFFPMEEIYKDSFWTGYYTSRPNTKRYIREFSAMTQISNTLYAVDMFKLKGLQTNLTAETQESWSLSSEQGLL